MIAVSARPAKRNWITISFASTLYLCPVLDLLLAEVPRQWQAELRLGLQEALVNAAKHGNQLDPGKTVLVRFSILKNQLWWIISDQGIGFKPPHCCCSDEPTPPASSRTNLPHTDHECGRGLYILHQVFDRVEWNYRGTELTLCKDLA
ncbi:MAG: anti-sigma regulatory factor [Oscillatoriales cyanobacterium RM2_1_1]|nr:anti-sigma regulatory factor [Oscillatoriales cyanobacterium SM2_3_0]NJO44993.1 anti-sigma regulatory factor [Oscillatoriales cyanobacterium RM2_1_1]